MDGFQSKTRRNIGLKYPHGETTPDTGQTIEVAPGIEWVRMPLPFSLKFINLWLIDDGDGWTIVDTGMPLPETKDAWRSLLGGRVTDKKPLKRVIVTHMHPDHVGNAGWLTHKFGGELWMSRLEYITCRMLVADTGRDAPKAGLDFYQQAAWSKEQIDHYKKRFGGFGRAVSRMPDAYWRLEDGFEFQMAGQDWQVIVGHGHSPEHACLYCPAMNVVISGDQLLPRISSNVSVFPTEPAANPLKDWIESCEKLKAALPEDVLVLPAHNEPFVGAHPRLQHLIDGHETALRRLMSRLEAAEMTVPETFTSLFGRAIKLEDFGMATGEALAHLNCLIYRGQATKQLGADGVSRYRAV
jgi:glyoxylase-like metal-dependent hydrolase (beta-lactamase superfamily II)